MIRWIAVAVILQAPCLLMAQTQGLRHPAQSPDGSRLAFDYHGDLYVVAAEGGAARRLTDAAADERKPAWSPDGTSLVYSSELHGNRDLFVLELEDGSVRQLTFHEARDDAPGWSPDGRWIAFHSNRDPIMDLPNPDPVHDVWVVPAAGGTPTRLTMARGENPAWSPDGIWIAYDRYSSGYADGEHNLWVIPVAGGSPRRLTSGPEDSRHPTWREGQLYFSHEANGIHHNDSTPNIWRRAVDQGALIQVSRSSGDGLRWPSATEQSEWIVFEWAFGLGRVRAAGGEPEAIPIQVEAEYPDEVVRVLPLRYGAQQVAWSPDGKSLAFILHDALFLLPVEGGEARLLSEEGAVVCDPSWRPDGQAVLCVTGEDPARRQFVEYLAETGAALLTRPAAQDSPGGVEVRVAKQEGSPKTCAFPLLSRREYLELKYRNLIQRRRERVEEASGGRMGYYHIPVMSVEQLGRFGEAIQTQLGEKEALVLDIRDGMGGFIHRPLLQLLDSTSPERLNLRPACYWRTRDGQTAPDVYDEESSARFLLPEWDRPVILIQNEVSRSDKELFPHTFRHLGLGWIVGMPTAGGVIGGGDVRMADGSMLTLSSQGWFTYDGRNMEGWGVPPDLRVPLLPPDVRQGRDPQLEKAVEVLLLQLEGKYPAPRAD